MDGRLKRGGFTQRKLKAMWKSYKLSLSGKPVELSFKKFKRSMNLIGRIYIWDKNLVRGVLLSKLLKDTNDLPGDAMLAELLMHSMANAIDPKGSRKKEKVLGKTINSFIEGRERMVKAMTDREKSQRTQPNKWN